MQIAGSLEIDDLAQILKDIMALKEELSSIAEATRKDDKRNTSEHNERLSKSRVNYGPAFFIE